MAKVAIASKFVTELSLDVIIRVQSDHGAEQRLLAGSVMRGEGTAHSDLDVVPLYESIPCGFRESFTQDGWPVEVFVHDLETLHYFLEEIDRTSGIPSLANMVAEGIEIPSATPLSSQAKAMARALLDRGPPPLSAEALSRLRYGITDLCDDFISPRTRAEALGTAAKLFESLANFYFRSTGVWSAKGKSISKRLNQVDPAFAKKFEWAFESFYSRGETTSVIEMATEILTPFGGKLEILLKVVDRLLSSLGGRSLRLVPVV